MKFTYAVCLVLSSYVLYKYKQKAQKLILVNSNNRLSRLFHLINANFFDNFKPTIFLFSGHAQTFLIEILSIIVRFFKNIFKYKNYKYNREIFCLSDGCRIAIDHAIKNKNNGEEYEKILIVLPGVTSTSEDYYVRILLEDFCDEYDCRVVNARGFGGMKLDSPLMISSACYKDIEEYILKVSLENPNKKIFGIGFSFGGMLLARYLGTNPAKIPNNFIAGCGVCYPCCLEQTKNYAEVHFNGIYSKASLGNIKTTFFENINNLFDQKYHSERNTEHIIEDKEQILKQINECKLMSEFDEVWTTRSLGLKDVSEYYVDSKLDQYISNIKVPFFSIFSEDDPIIPIDSVPFTFLQNNANTVTVVTQHGGHLGFFSGLLIPQRLIHQPLKTFLKTVEILKDTEPEK